MPSSAAQPRREAGVLLHPTSLAGPHGIGNIGGGGRAFVDWLARAGMSVWQILPLSPTHRYHAPYVSWSAFAGNPLLLDLWTLKLEGLLEESDLQAPTFPDERVDFEQVTAFKLPRLEKAAARLLSRTDSPLYRELEAFRARAGWAKESALFFALKTRAGLLPWWEWPAPLRDREPGALAKAERELEGPIANMVTLFFLFEREWAGLRAYAHERKIDILGDLSIYVDHDSADVWSNRDLFHLDARGRPSVVSGVPPDYFSATGQLWGNPIYRWERMERDDFAWWRARLGRALAMCDRVRIDHFRAFSAYWEVPYGAPDARTGKWVKGPGLRFFEAMKRSFSDSLPILAEDLGTIDEDVHRLRDSVGLPGMRVLEFGFDGYPNNTHLPHQHTRTSIVYTGTHDNDTTRGWYEGLRWEEKERVRNYFGIERDDPELVVRTLVRAAFASVGDTAIVPMQDVLGLGGWARMNDPSRLENNWSWRVREGALRADAADGLRKLADTYGRLR